MYRQNDEKAQKTTKFTYETQFLALKYKYTVCVT